MDQIDKIGFGTYLVNSSKQEYVIIGNDYPTYVNLYLQRLEKYNWDLRIDNIYVSHMNIPYTFSRVSFRAE